MTPFFTTFVKTRKNRDFRDFQGVPKMAKSGQKWSKSGHFRDFACIRKLGLFPKKHVFFIKKHVFFTFPKMVIFWKSLKSIFSKPTKPKIPKKNRAFLGVFI